MDKFPFLDIERIMTNQLGIEVGVITLNRSNALNALNKQMIIGLKTILSQWAEDNAIEMVIIKGKGAKAYCAGGDIKALYDDGDIKFLGGEYKLDFALYSYPKPVLHLAHGYVMGGGLGLLNSGKLRLSFPDAQFAMPETAIGFFPDVGMRYYFSRIPKGLGAFFAMTGARMTPSVAKAFGLIDHILPPFDRALLIVKLFEFISKWSRRDGELVECLFSWVPKLHDEYARSQDEKQQIPLTDEQVLQQFPKAIVDWCDFFWDFPHIPWYEDLFALAREFHQQCESLFTLGSDGIDSASPLSLFVTEMLLRRAKEQELEQVFNEDYWLAHQLYSAGDLREGIKAKLIDRRPAQWQFPYDKIDKDLLLSLTPPDEMAEILRQKIKWRDE